MYFFSYAPPEQGSWRRVLNSIGMGLGLLCCASSTWAAKPNSNPTAVIVTSLGTIKCELFPKVAPKAVSNFIGLATGTKAWTDPQTGKTVHRPLYNGTIFHRVIPQFMIQGGDPLGTGIGGPGYTFGYETDPNLRFDVPGRLAMAHSGMPDSNGCQFFITTDAPPDKRPTYLNGQYTIFGQVTGGQSVVDEISNVARGAGDRPLRPILIKKITIEQPGKSPATSHTHHGRR